MPLPKKKILSSLFLAIWIYSLITFGYVWTNVYVFPEDQYAGLSNYFNVPTDLVGVASFVISFVFFFLWNAIRENSK